MRVTLFGASEPEDEVAVRKAARSLGGAAAVIESDPHGRHIFVRFHGVAADAEHAAAELVSWWIRWRGARNWN